MINISLIGLVIGSMIGGGAFNIMLIWAVKPVD